jgi:hypothetical protein
LGVPLRRQPGLLFGGMFFLFEEVIPMAPTYFLSEKTHIIPSSHFYLHNITAIPIPDFGSDQGSIRDKSTPIGYQLYC